MLILYYDEFWDQPAKDDVLLPDGFFITTDRRRYSEAAVVVFHIPAWKRKPRWLLPKKEPHHLWVAWCLESAENYPRLNNAGFMRVFDLTMTYRLDSDVPIPYFMFYISAGNLAEQLRRTPHPKTATAPVVMLISSRADRSGRRAYARELARYMQIDSYGRFLNNARLDHDQGRQSKLETIGKYKFNLAFENSIDVDYVTEKFFDPLVVGSVPVYLGAPNVATFAPGERCFINATDFHSPRDLADYLHSLAHDEAAYESYLVWKQRPFLPAFSSLLDRFHEHQRRRLCSAVMARLSSSEPMRGA
jgi:hypothetical protein